MTLGGLKVLAESPLFCSPAVPEALLNLCFQSSLRFNFVAFG